MNNRTKVIFRTPGNVVETILQLKGYGYKGAYVSFDPQPLSERYYRELFQQLRDKQVEFDLTFASWSLPAPEFIKDFARTFTPWSSIYISPESGSERLRRATRGLSFTNAELLEALRQCRDAGVKATLFFSLGIPGETAEDFAETIALKQQVEREFKNVDVVGFAVEVEPASPWYMSPERFGITITRNSLDSFLKEQASPCYSSMATLGYYQRNYLGQEVTDAESYADQVLKTKCEHFCKERGLCAAAACFWSAVDLLHLSASGDARL